MRQTFDRCRPAVRASYRVERTGELFLLWALRKPPLADAVCARLDNLAYWRAALAPQASSALGNPCPVSAATRYR
jgi:hypothetical protein